ncbi:flavohemoprotein [Phormidium tenue FACHB-886]|nr:flavohemoprotein [Phormidium tenue FACHB-886]
MTLDLERLEQSFEKVKGNALEFAASFYHNLFSDYPEAQPLFAHTNMAAQQKKLLDSLILVIENLRRPEVLTHALKGLGTRHMQYGARPEHYPLVGNTLLKTFEQYLGADWTPETQQAWTNAYTAITSLMLDGAEHVQDSASPNLTVLGS